MNKYRSIYYLIISLLTGCAAGTPFLPGPTAHTVVKPGSILTLNTALSIPSHSAGVRIQNGKVAGDKVNDWNPNCRFEVLNPEKTDQEIQPGKFTIKQVGVEYSQVSVGEITNMRTNFFLKSEQQPQITKLYCQAWWSPDEARHLMLSEVEQAVGKIFTFQPKPAS